MIKNYNDINNKIEIIFSDSIMAFSVNIFNEESYKYARKDIVQKILEPTLVYGFCTKKILTTLQGFSANFGCWVLC